jgi:hypothetical protein
VLPVVWFGNWQCTVNRRIKYSTLNGSKLHTISLGFNECALSKCCLYDKYLIHLSVDFVPDADTILNENLK